MRTCIICNKNIDNMKATAIVCSPGCRTEAYRQRQGIPKPDFMTNSKPMHATNEHRGALSIDDKHRVRVLKNELDNIQKLYDNFILKSKEYNRLIEIYRVKKTLPTEYLVFFSDMEAPPKKPERAMYEYPLTYLGKIEEIDENKVRKKHTSKKSMPDDEKTQNEYEKLKKAIDEDFNNSPKISNFIENQQLKSVLNTLSKIKGKKYPIYPPPARYYKTIEVFDEAAYKKELDELKEKNEKEKAKKSKIEEENRSREQANKSEIRRFENEEKLYQEYCEFTKMNNMQETKDDGTILGIRKLKTMEVKLDDMINDCLITIKRIKNELSEIYPEVPRTDETPYQKRTEQPGPTTGADLAKMKFKIYQFNEEWENLLGKPSRPFSAMVFGDAKAGKSFFCLTMAQYLTLFGDVLYIACEEGLSETTKRKIEVTEAYDVVINSASKLEDIIQALDQEKYQFCFIDSVSHARMNIEDFQRLKERFPKTSFIAILQTTKSNQFKGEKEWLHDADTIIELTKTAPRTTKIEVKGRFGAGEKIITY